MNFRHLLRASKWARNPPSARQVMLALGVLVLCLGLFALERAQLLPDWMQADPRPKPPKVQPLN